MGHAIDVAGLTFPEHENVPAALPQRGFVPPVPLDIAIQFGLPELAVRSGYAVAGAIFMAMPKATVNEDHFSAWPEHKVGAARQILHMEAVAVAHCVDQPSDAHLWLGVFAADPAHDVAALAGREGVQWY